MENLSHQIVDITGVHFGFSSRPLYQDVNIRIPRGKVTVIMGPSGCGKSTLLGLIGGRLRPSSGRIEFDGAEVEQRQRKSLYELRKRMGMMFQHSALLTDLSVFENIAFPLREHTDLPEELIHHVVLMKLEMVGLRGARDLYPDELSGGMARRVALARAIVMDPDLVMYDEPFTGLDPISKGIVVKLIRELNDALNMSSIVVTHDVDDGLSIADYVYLLGNGGVLGQGTTAEIQNSGNQQITQFLRGLPDGPVPYHYPSDVGYQDDLLGQESRGV